MKRIAVIILLLLVVFFTFFIYWSNHVKKEVENLLKFQEETVKSGKIEEYMNSITKYNLEYQEEKESWFRDIINSGIKDFQLTLKGVKILGLGKLQVTVLQTYEYLDQSYGVVFPLQIVKEGNRWKDNDLNFKVMKTDNFTIKYFEQSKEEALIIKSICEEAKGNVENRYGSVIDDNTTIKIYKNLEMLRQSVKLSFPWQFAGWYEYPESIKISTLSSNNSYKRVLEHELVHKLTLRESNNNIPYWFTEGTAVYMANFYNDLNQINTIDRYFEVYGEGPLDILKLESINLEMLHDHKMISKYYDSAGLIVKYMVQTYGLEDIKKIISLLGEYPYQKGTGSEIDEISKHRFNTVLPKAIGITINQLNKNWINQF